MSSQIKERILNDIKQAMKENHKEKRDALRMLSSALKQIEVDERKILEDKDVIGILKKAYKQRVEAAEAYKNAGREDLYEKESFEMQVILEYLPKQLNDEELKVALEGILNEIGTKSKKDMGKIMGMASKNLGEVADGKRISETLKSMLE
ncbi:GatB/YqeY domain-containing protein [Helicobacter sp. MIT 05-5294]|uniref:GatB/YqeY domain-containing protein n=1 Tax=Helicobacter sp. MIT 05-5294 TaxID=1548150 RepID=UPI00051FE9EF|nr:GatB/YqeY domain-containing protein [Helicobacter sp. MIT 05-5294]TLD87035.1 GatB/YqeY domain-containing protein [Helicobacter sp. MIT 05-5294]